MSHIDESCHTQVSHITHRLRIALPHATQLACGVPRMTVTHKYRWSRMPHELADDVSHMND